MVGLIAEGGEGFGTSRFSVVFWRALAF